MQDHFDNYDEQQDDPGLPPQLVSDLRARFGRSPTSKRVDEAVHAAAAHRLGRPSTRTWLPIAGSIAAVLVAAIGLAMWLSPAATQTPPSAPPPRPLASAQFAPPEDIDGDGRIDIRDALVIARALAAGEPGSPRWDVTSDGLIDTRDIDAVAMAAVSLTRNAS